MFKKYKQKPDVNLNLYKTALQNSLENAYRKLKKVYYNRCIENIITLKIACLYENKCCL